MPSTVELLVLGIPLLVAAFLAVRVRSLVHSVLWLGVVLAGSAVAFAMLGASFLATVQVLLYIGGIITLLIFAVMLTSRPEGADVSRTTNGHVRAGIVAAALFALLASAILRTPGLDAPAVADAPTTSQLADVLLGKDLLAFEVLSVLLLAAMIGAAVIARSRDAGAPRAAAARPEPMP